MLPVFAEHFVNILYKYHCRFLTYEKIVKFAFCFFFQDIFGDDNNEGLDKTMTTNGSNNNNSAGADRDGLR